MTEITDIKEILTELGYHDLRAERDGFRTNRIYANGDNKTALKVFNTGFWVDFVSGAKGQIKDLIAITLGYKDIKDSEKWLSEHKISINIKQEQCKPKITETKKFDPSTLQNLLPIHDYWLNRGISQETLLLFKGGLCTKKCKMASRYVFPVFNSKNEIISFWGRDITNESPIKWKGVNSKGQTAYPAFLNYENIKEKGEIIICESIGDILSCWEAGIKNTLCLFGVEMSVFQVNYLLKLNLNKIIISLNNDSENNSVGNLASERLKKKLLRFFDWSQLDIILPNLKDWNEVLTKEGKQSIIKQLCG